MNLARFYKMLFTQWAFQSALCNICDSPHCDEEDEGEEEATQRHSTADKRQHLQSPFILLAPLTHTRRHTEHELQIAAHTVDKSLHKTSMVLIGERNVTSAS